MRATTTRLTLSGPAASALRKTELARRGGRWRDRRDGSRGYRLARLGGRGYQRLSRSLPATTRTGTLLASTNEEFTEIFTRLYERLEPEIAEISKLQWLV